MSTHGHGVTTRDRSTSAAGAPHTMSVRFAALGGAVFFALVVINANLLSGAPRATDSGREILRYVTDHQGRLQISAVLWGFAMAAALVWLPGHFRALRRAEGGTPGIALVALAGGMLAAASTVMGALVVGTTAARISDLDATGAGFGWTMYLMSIGATLLGLSLLIGATAVVCLRTKLFGSWFGVTSAVLALVSLVGAFTLGFNGDAIQVVAGIGALLDAVWIFVVSVSLWRNPNQALP